jgi:antitoxin MazE
MHTKAQMWGNSLSVRIPKSVAEKIGLKDQDTLEIEVQDDKLVLLPGKEQGYKLKDLIKGVTKKNLHKEVDFGSPAGQEML